MLWGQNLDSNVYMWIESVDHPGKTVLADFVESNNFADFFGITGRLFAVDGPSMVLFTNYKYKKKEGAIYPINKLMVERLGNENRITIVENSFIIRAEINLQGIDEDIFGKSISHRSLNSLNPHIYSFWFGRTHGAPIELPQKGRIEIVVKNIGQGSWSEIKIDGKHQLIFDAGTHYSTKTDQVIAMYGDSDLVYQDDKPGLIISHWDVDHYHFLKAMHDSTIRAFKFILCRDFVPSLMSRVVFSRISRLNPNCIALPADSRKTSIRETPLFDCYDNQRFTIFNSGESRNRNKDGFSLLIRNSIASVLLAGDQHYRQFDLFVVPKYLNYKHVHYMVVPHHGGNAGTFTYSLDPKVRRGKAIISVGRNQYGHPFSKVMKCLNAATFRVYRTDVHEKDIMIQLY